MSRDATFKPFNIVLFLVLQAGYFWHEFFSLFLEAIKKIWVISISNLNFTRGAKMKITGIWKNRRPERNIAF
jgi:hypothetical protein